MSTANFRARGPASTGEVSLPERVEIRDRHGSVVRIVSRQQALKFRSKVLHSKADEERTGI